MPESTTTRRGVNGSDSHEMTLQGAFGFPQRRKFERAEGMEPSNVLNAAAVAQ
jgi:hypothetical protein